MEILNIAHRGYSGKFDENTMLAFKKAIEYNADGIETDVQLSKDGIPVLIHDETLDRTTNGYGFVKDYTLDELKIFRTKTDSRLQALKAEALEEIKYLKSKNTYFNNGDKTLKFGQYTLGEIEYFENKSGEEIPTLRELLELVSSSDLKVLNLELKNNIIEYNGLEEKVLAMVDQFNLRDRVIISSFNHLSLVKIRKLEEQSNRNENTDKKIVLGALSDAMLYKVQNYLKNMSIECYHPYFPSVLNKEYMKEIKKSGILVNPYTVNTVADMKKVMEAGVDGIITNEVELLNTMVN